MSAKITRKDLWKVFLNHLTLQISWSYERMQALGFAISISPILKKVYADDKEGYKQALTRHMEFINTCPNYGATVILGIVAALEEQHSDPELIRGIKTGMMGPLAGIGDSMMFAILGPLLISIPASMALTKDFTGALIALALTQIIFISWNFFVKWKLITLGYDQGVNLTTNSEGMMQKVTFGAGILGLVVVGGMIGSIINVTTPIVATFGDYVFNMQETL
ncbi:PTS system mannose/fructose/sorbose family transporter subunit IID, partial [Clostridium sp.]|uniref:PTS system mannose/fructose/sorbose family transporter subunit IID n=1 Tax=Clostridium sp. TaxID=1506 RepID=UPI003F3F242D